jgi:lactate racemase
MIGRPNSTWALLEGNPVQGEIREAVAMAPPHFIVNVAVNTKRHITAVWAGHYIEAHKVGCRFVAQHATRPVDEPFDVVVSTNSGYPLDQNLYQTVKGMSAAARIVIVIGNQFVHLDARVLHRIRKREAQSGQTRFRSL